MKKVIIIGSGFSGLSAACYLAKQGYDVTIYEKNDTIGGRARQLCRENFRFDMGPTFYWMPDVFESFFEDFGKSSKDYYKLIRLDPGYEVYFDKGESISISARLNEIFRVFEEEEPGSSHFLREFLSKAGYNYWVAMERVVHKPGDSLMELVMPETISQASQFLFSLSHLIRKNIKSPRLRQILEFPVIFLGAKPTDIPSFYCFMNYADMKLGTWHIEGGMYQLVKGMEDLAKEMGVTLLTNSPVDQIVIKNGKTTGVIVKDTFHPADVVISGADYHHSEALMEKKFRNYPEKYWKERVMAPSALLYYVAFNKKLKNISHHTLFFDKDFDTHARKIYDDPGWPDNPLFYASFPTKTDKTMAPEGKEGGVFLVPIASGLKDTQEVRQFYFNNLIDRMEMLTGQSLKDDILFHESYASSDFIKDYNAYKGNAYGLSNILFQTAYFKPKVRNKKVGNLFYTGQLTVPGPGVPPAIISGKIAAGLANIWLKKQK